MWLKNFWTGKTVTSIIKYVFCVRKISASFVALRQCFSTGGSVEPPVASKGSAESNQETRTSQHLRPLDTSLQCICWGSLERSPRPLSWWLGARCPSPKNPFLLRPLASNFVSHDRFIPTPMGSVSYQNCCKGFHFIEKGWKTLHFENEWETL